MIKRFVAIGLFLFMMLSMTACGGSSAKSYVVTETDGTNVTISVNENAPKVSVKTNGDTFTIGTSSGDAQGKVIDREEIDGYLVAHYNDIDFVEYTVNDFDCFGYGGDEGTAFTHVLSISDSYGVILVASSQTALYDAETYVTFSVGSDATTQ